MHNRDPEKGNSWMMWVMMICCGLPLLILLIIGFSGNSLGSSNWPVLGGVVLMMLVHFFMMKGMQGKSRGGKNDSNADDKHSGHNCH